MPVEERLQDLLAHMEWADATLWRVVLESELRDPRIETGLHHIHLVQHAFSKRISLRADSWTTPSGESVSPTLSWSIRIG